MSTDTPTAASTGIAGGSPTLYVADLDRSVEFYTNTLGLGLQYRAGEHFAMVDAGRGFSIGLHPQSTTTPNAAARGNVQISFGVGAPIEQVVANLQARGVQFDERHGNTIIDEGVVKLAYFHDPDGTELFLCEVQEP